MFTFDGLTYDFQGAGEYVLAEGPEFAVHTRFARPSGTNPAVTFNHGVAAKVGGSIIAFGHGAAGFENCRDLGAMVIDSRGANVEGPAPSNQCFLDNTGDKPATDPVIGPLAPNPPGTTRTRALLPGSPAIDIVPLATLCLQVPPLPRDQRGILRPQGAACDAGAYEVEVAPPATVTPAAAIATTTPVTTRKKKCKKKKKRSAAAAKRKCKKKKK